jgi:hypothetical protein
MAGARRPVIVLICAILSASSAAAYSHFIHYSNRIPGPIPEKFDLNALPNRTVTFLVSESGPAQFAAGDSFASVLAQIRQAAQVWNSVETSELRVAFGGLFSPGISQATPAGEVVFDGDLPPGVLAVGGPTARASDAQAGPAGPFVPILKATVRLNRDLTNRPAFTEAFFGTVVHEMGHALGLQHTMTSSAMSTFTRTTYRLRPLEADDIAGLSQLYPTRSFQTNTGTIAGRVTSGGQPVHLASVTAIRPSSAAVSALTNPDGTYQIQGLTQDSYYVYVSALPAPTQEGLGPGDLVLPADADGRPIAATGPIETLFFPGTRDPQQAVPVGVTRGGRLDNIDFSVQRRAAVPIYDPSVFSYFNGRAVKPAFLNGTAPTGLLVVRGPGLVSGNGAVSGLEVRVLGGLANVSGTRPNQGSFALDLAFPGFAGNGPRHLVFSTPSDTYVFPSAFHIVQKQPPMVAGINAMGDGTAAILGANISAETRFFFDGIPGTVRGYSGSDAVGTAIVVPPQGVGNRATVVAYNPDGMNSTFLQESNAPAYTLDASDSGVVRVEPSAIPAGADAMVEITGVNTRFTDGQTVVGFGSSDILVRRLWVLSATRMLASVSVAPGAMPAPSFLSLISGFRVTSQPFAFQVTAPDARTPRVSAQLQNMNAAQSGIYAGSIVALSGFNLTTVPNGNTTTITLNDTRVNIMQAGPSQVAFQIPQNLGSGPIILRLFNGQENALPIVFALDAQPPQISGLSLPGGRGLDAVRPGDVVTMLVSDTAAAEPPDASDVRIRIGDQEVQAMAVAPAGQARAYSVFWMVPQNMALGSATLSVRIGSRSSEPVHVTVRL